MGYRFWVAGILIMTFSHTLMGSSCAILTVPSASRAASGRPRWSAARRGLLRQVQATSQAARPRRRSRRTASSTLAPTAASSHLFSLRHLGERTSEDGGVGGHTDDIVGLDEFGSEVAAGQTLTRIQTGTPSEGF